MSILIKGIEIPKEFNPNYYIELACGIDGKQYARLYNFYCGGLTEWCEVIPIPPHGRLIDADAALRDGWTINRTYSASPTEMVYEVKAIDCLPTIIPAERSEE